MEQLGSTTATPAGAATTNNELHKSDSSAESAESSADSEWHPDSEGSDANEFFGSDGGEDSSDVDAVDTSINLINEDLRSIVSSLIQGDPCEKKCLEGKTKLLEQFLCSLSQMTAREKKQSVMTTLAVLKKTDTVLRHRDHGLREQFNYYLPLIGQVCRGAWCKCFGVSTATITRYQNRINDGVFSVKAHGNRLNQNASAVDLRWLVAWYKEFARSVGEVVPVRVRRKETQEGTVKLYYSDAEYTMLPAYFTWDQLYLEMHNYVEELRIPVREPKPSTFRLYLSKLCPTIRIRSPLSNVCDVCSIYSSRIKTQLQQPIQRRLANILLRLDE